MNKEIMKGNIIFCGGTGKISQDSIDKINEFTENTLKKKKEKLNGTIDLITWRKSEITNKEYGSTAEDIEHEQQSKYEIEHNTHLIINSSHHNTLYLASTEDAKQCAELIERGRVS